MGEKEFSLYEAYWGLKEKPFENTPDPRFLYQSEDIGDVFTRLLYTLNGNRGAALLTPEVLNVRAWALIWLNTMKYIIIFKNTRGCMPRRCNTKKDHEPPGSQTTGRENSCF